MVLSATLFVNSLNLKRQLDDEILMAYNECYTNIVHYGSRQRHPVPCLVMNAKTHALVYDFDIGMLF